MIQYTNQKLCTSCGGRCCRNGGGIYAPEDFEELTFNSILKLYYENQIMFYPVLDSENARAGYILRVPQKGCEKIQRTANPEKGICAFWKENEGCTCKDYRSRPKGCKLMIPREINGKLSCIPLYGENEAIKEWLYYEAIVNNVCYYLLSLSRPEESFDKLQCAICGGKCCKNSGCYFSPKDFRNISLEKMRAIISKGYISMTFVPKVQTGLEDDVIIVKVRNKYADVCDMNPNESNGGCILLEKTGCSFDDDDRPYGGRVLVPEKLEGKTCTRGYSFRQCAEDWLSYQDILKVLYGEFLKKKVEFEGIC